MRSGTQIRLQMKKRTSVVNFNLEIELERELNKARIVARRDDSSEIARVAAANASGVRVNHSARLYHSNEIADRIGEVDVVEEIENFGAEFDIS